MVSRRMSRDLALDPEILVADAMVSALDVSIQAQLLAWLSDINARFGRGMLFVTQGLRVAPRICDRVAVMRALFAAMPGAAWEGASPEP